MPKKIPNSIIMQHFFNLPEEQRILLLQQNLSPAYIKDKGAAKFQRTFFGLRSKPEKEAKAFLKQYFGDSEKHLKDTIAHGEVLLGGHKENEYTTFHAKTDEEKLYAQLCSATLAGRLVIFYDDLNEKDQAPYDREALRTMNPIVTAAKLEDPANYAQGKSPESFLEDVKKTMDLSNEPSLMEHLRTGIPADDPERSEKLHLMAQQYMIYPESQLAPEELARKFRDKDWKKSFDTQKNLKKENERARLRQDSLVRRIKSAVKDIPETEEEKTLFKEAALQTCKDYVEFRNISKDTDDPEDKEFLKLMNDLQEDLAAEGLKQKGVQDLRVNLAEEYTTLQKEKSGWFLSKTNSPEYNNMMKHLKLFNAKMDLLSGQQPKEPLTEEERKTVENTNADVLLVNAKQGCYNYGTLKTKNGTGSIWHDAGSERFNASMKTLSQLGELGKKLHLSDPATAVRDEAQLQVLKNRGDGKWLKNNIADAVAKSICAQVLLNKKTPVIQQRTRLEKDALTAQVEKIKSSNRFRTMMEMTKPEELADAVIKGGTSLYEVYHKADQAVKAAGAERITSEIEPDSLKTEKETQGLVPGYHQ